jgi:hypothetical protein
MVQRTIMQRNTNESIGNATAATFRKLAPWLLLAAFTAIGAAQSPTGAPAKSEPIPMDQIGAVAGKQYHGDGLSIAVTPEGARLRCVFQKLEGQATREGLWLTSTTEYSKGERFRVMASTVGRAGQSPTVAAEVTRLTSTPDSKPEPPCVGSSEVKKLPRTGKVEVASQVVRFLRLGLIEEYSVSMDGVRQDFVVLERPEGVGQLHVELHVAGATAEPGANGARLVLEGSGRKIAYGRLRAADVTGKELTARIEVSSAAEEVTRLKSNEEVGKQEAEMSQSLLTSAATSGRLAVVVDDAEAIYPVRIDPTFSDDNWISLGGLPGASDIVYAAVADAAGNLYIGGDFTVVGDVIANRVAKWNGSAWSPLGLGVGSTVYALAVSGTDLYAGGYFTYATNAGPTAINVNYIAKWNGSAWSPLGSGVGSTVYALAVSGTDLYAGGYFSYATNAGPTAINVNYIAKWNGSTWSALGSGMGGSVSALAVLGADLYAGGQFTTAGGSTANRIAKWNGSGWSALGSGVNGSVSALAVLGADLYVGGVFTTASGSTANRIAKWNGSGWSALGSGMNYQVSALAVSGTDLYAGGQFTTAGGSTANRIAKWSGSAWSALGSGMSDAGNQVYALAVSGTDLYAGGQFTMAGGSAANYIAKWNGSVWSALGSGMNYHVSALAVSDSDLYAGGVFTTASGSTANRIAKWNGNAWSALGSGMNGAVVALAVSGTDLYAGGYFTTAGGSAANFIAKWNGNAWSAVGSGMSSYVYALAVSGTDLYAGGYFTTAGGGVANCIAKWNGSAWSTLGSGMNNQVCALAASGTDLYAGGSFTTADGSAAKYIAKWNGSAWSALGLGMNNYVLALALSGTDLYAGGSFTTADGSAANYIAKWNGSAWSALGSGMNNQVWALAASGTDLYAGGDFTTAGASAANYIAKWNGSAWSALGSGVGGGGLPYVSALAVSGTSLYAGGWFTTVGAKVSGYVAKANVSAAGGQFSSLSYWPASGFSCTFRGATVGQPYRIQVSPSLAIGSWTDVANFTYTNPITITDPNSTGTTRRFYRAVWEP